MAKHRPKPLMLMILDGWGWRTEKKANAVELGRTPHWHALWKNHPHTLLAACGEDVGLPAGTMGNSEVGHLNIGAGRVVYQDLSRINRSIADKSFFVIPELTKNLTALAQSGKPLHLIGLCSDIGVHAHIDHLFALIDAAKNSGVKSVFIHAITDGRDSPPDSGLGYIERIQKKAEESEIAKIATVSGRYYAMDRDKRWDRIAKAFAAIVDGEGKKNTSAMDAVKASYAEGITDEFIIPSVIMENTKPVGKIQDGDGVLFFNFRSDRARELTRAFTFENFSEFPRARSPKLSFFLGMTRYDETFHLPALFPPEKLTNILSAVLSRNGLTQLHIAETEKYAHVTFFFNGGEEKPFPGEERILIPSPKDVATYDLKPQMSADEVTDAVLKDIAAWKSDVIILNFANGDMVGHSGKLDAAIKAVERVDACLKKIVDAVLKNGGELLITADHGNCEEMEQAGGSPLTSHSMNPVPMIHVVDPVKRHALRSGGRLCDIAPTMLDILGIPQPAEMTGKSLIT